MKVYKHIQINKYTFYFQQFPLIRYLIIPRTQTTDIMYMPDPHRNAIYACNSEIFGQKFIIF